jgi:hypothetical protein
LADELSKRRIGPAAGRRSVAFKALVKAAAAQNGPRAKKAKSVKLLAGGKPL